MDEDFDFSAWDSGELFDFRDGQFAGSNDALDIHLQGLADAGRVVDCHLGAGVQLEFREVLFDDCKQSQVLDDEGVDFEVAQLRQQGDKAGQFLFLNQGVDRHIDFSTPFLVVVGDANEDSQVVEAEVISISAGGEVMHTKIDGIGAIMKGGDAGFEVFSRRK